eukprot:TRINITY_DN9097_c0_g1_i2.p1 TRINITY_DN9097_c0_g1~~TRINITY_DN9097_c0_g1_i2.p1  ORF type:complete len:602 (-),score=168.72 TRINITY_DN9097_c0_g1_i2:51-1856(-)
MNCPSCGSQDIETREDEGLRCCTSCGEILPYDALRIEVTWTSGSGGSSSMTGQNISLEVSSASKGAQRIRELAILMEMPQIHTDAALRIHKLARDNNFTKGRKVDHVAVACLYAVCRRSNVPVMLIDFADKVGITVQVLGHTFLGLCNSLHLDVKILDPSLYIDKFAAKLEFGNKEAEVASTALRFIQSMNRDWIIIGRRPAGICGAALMMAARVHGFNRTPADLVHIVRVGDKTLMKRISEFLNTPAAQLTAEELEAEVQPEGEALPPAYLRARRKEAEKGKKRKKKSKSSKKKKKVKKGSQSSSSSSSSYEEEEESSESLDEKKVAPPSKKRKLNLLEVQNQTTLEGIKDILDEETEESLDEADVLTDITSTFKILEKAQEEKEKPSQKKPTRSRTTQRASSTPGTQEIEAAFLPRILAAPAEPILNPTGEDTFSDIDSDELEGYLVPMQEVKIKERVWSALNGEFYKKRLEEKKKEQLLASQGQPKRRRNKINAGSAGEAAALASQTRSSLINWDALSAFDELQADFALDNDIDDFLNLPTNATTNPTKEAGTSTITKEVGVTKATKVNQREVPKPEPEPESESEEAGEVEYDVSSFL